MLATNIAISHDQIQAFCRKWMIREFSLFGSVVRDDFRPDSDVDVLVSFDPESKWSLFDIVDMRDELAEMFGRPVDLVEREALINPYRKRSILSDLVTLYAA